MRIKIQQLLGLLLVLLMINNVAIAGNIESVITKSDVNKNATISVSVKDAKTGKTIYEYNSHKLMNPASVLKVFTMRSAYKELGSKYLF